MRQRSSLPRSSERMLEQGDSTETECRAQVGRTDAFRTQLQESRIADKLIFRRPRSRLHTLALSDCASGNSGEGVVDRGRTPRVQGCATLDSAGLKII